MSKEHPENALYFWDEGHVEYAANVLIKYSSCPKKARI